MLRLISKTAFVALTATCAALSSFWAVEAQQPKPITPTPTGKTYRQKVLDANPVGYWRLGETGGSTAKDETKFARHGTYNGKPIFAERGAIHNDLNTAIRFDGSKSYVEIPADRAFSQPTSGKGLTVEVWFRPDALVFDGETDDPYVFWLGKGTPGQFEWAFRFYSKNSTRPNRISAYIFNKEGGLGAGAYFQDEIKPKEWIHIVATFDLGNKTNAKAGVSIYKNGTLRGSPATQKGALYSSFNITPQAGTAPVRLATRSFGSFLVGGLDEFAIYPRVLTAAEVADHYKTGSGKAK
jgi:Concanavalin A-like lectin/glucanases superfamily